MTTIFRKPADWAPPTTAEEFLALGRTTAGASVRHGSHNQKSHGRRGPESGSGGDDGGATKEFGPSEYARVVYDGTAVSKGTTPDVALKGKAAQRIGERLSSLSPDDFCEGIPAAVTGSVTAVGTIYPDGTMRPSWFNSQVYADDITASPDSLVAFQDERGRVNLMYMREVDTDFTPLHPGSDRPAKAAESFEFDMPTYTSGGQDVGFARNTFTAYPVRTERGAAMMREVAASSMIQSWAATSNDSQSFCLAVQDVIRDRFGLTHAAGWRDPDDATAGAEHFTKARATADAALANPATTKVLGTFVQAQYDDTQAAFARAGYSPDDTIRLYRGVDLDQADKSGQPNLSRTDTISRPASSWTFDQSTAEDFGSDTAEAAIPVRDIFAVPGHGIGCWSEQEVVVLGRPHEAVWFDYMGNEVRAEVRAEPVNLDPDDAHADWPKRRWDMPTDMLGLRLALATWDEEHPLAVLAEMPVFAACPEPLRTEVLAEVESARSESIRHPGHPDQKIHGRRKGVDTPGWDEIGRHKRELTEKIRREHPEASGFDIAREEMKAYGDIEASALFDLAGYSGKPTVLSREEFEAFEGKGIEYGFSPHGYDAEPRTLFGRGFTARGWRSGEDGETTWVTGADAARHLMESDDYWVGTGIFTSGTYIGSPSVGTEFDGGGPPKTHSTIEGDSAYLAIKIKPEATVIGWDDLTTMRYDPNGDEMPRYLDSTTMLRDAISQGAQVINTSNHFDPLAGVVVLDRSVLVIEEFQSEGPRPPTTVEDIERLLP